MNILFLCFFSIVDKGFIVYTDNKVLTVGRVYISGTCTKCTVGSAFFVRYRTGIKSFPSKNARKSRNPLKKARF